MTVRAAHPDDLDALVGLCAALWPDEPADDHRAHMAATLAGAPASTLPLVVFVAVDGEDVIGFIEVGLRSHADGCDARQAVGFIEGWYVAPAHQRRSVGRALMSAAAEWARGQGAHELASDTWADNEGSQRAHVALGFATGDRIVTFRKAL